MNRYSIGINTVKWNTIWWTRKIDCRNYFMNIYHIK